MKYIELILLLAPQIRLRKPVFLKKGSPNGDRDQDCIIIIFHHF